MSALSYAGSRLGPITAVLCSSSSVRTKVLVAMAGASYDSEVNSLEEIYCSSAGRFFANWATRTTFLDHSRVLESLMFSASHDYDVCISLYTERTPLGASIFKRRYVWLGTAMNLARDGLPRMAW